MTEQIITFDPKGAKKYPHTATVEWCLGGIGQAEYADWVKENSADVTLTVTQKSKSS